MVEGVDVSGYNPGTDWNEVFKSGISFAFIKATEGLTYTNPLFSSDMAHSKSSGLLVGAYHFFHPHDDPTHQAQHFLNVIGELGPGDLPPVMDWEVHELTVVQEIKNAVIFLNYVSHVSGKTPIIYSSPSYINELGNPMLSQYPLWLADYAKKPTIPQPWSNYTFWQYSDSGKVRGIKGKCDLTVGSGDIDWLKGISS